MRGNETVDGRLTELPRNARGARTPHAHRIANLGNLPLPFIGHWPKTLPGILMQVGAPCLWGVYVDNTQMLYAITTTPEAMRGLEHLSISRVGESPDIPLLASVLAEGA